MPSWIIRRDRLDPEQKRIVDAQINSNIWISGFAGHRDDQPACTSNPDRAVFHSLR